LHRLTEGANSSLITNGNNANPSGTKLICVESVVPDDMVDAKSLREVATEMVSASKATTATTSSVNIMIGFRIVYTHSEEIPYHGNENCSKHKGLITTQVLHITIVSQSTLERIKLANLQVKCGKCFNIIVVVAKLLHDAARLVGLSAYVIANTIYVCRLPR
jgi:hypothetical protein